MDCEHDFQHIETLKRIDEGGYNKEFIKVDRFFCRKCLETKEVKRFARTRGTPDWY